MEYSTEKIYILDQRAGKVYIRPTPLEMIEKDGDEVLEYWAEKLGISASDCSYMIANDSEIDELTN